jgi:hypothetical protein
MSKELTLSEDDVREEHLKEVNTAAHWTYLFAALGGGFIVMLVVIAILGS